MSTEVVVVVEVQAWHTTPHTATQLLLLALSSSSVTFTSSFCKGVGEGRGMNRRGRGRGGLTEHPKKRSRALVATLNDWSVGCVMYDVLQHVGGNGDLRLPEWPRGWGRGSLRPRSLGLSGGAVFGWRGGTPRREIHREARSVDAGSLGGSHDEGGSIRRQPAASPRQP